MIDPIAATAQNRPLAGPARPYKFPAFSRFCCDNGLTVLVAPTSKLPIVSVTALIEAGCVCDPLGREGLAQLTARLLLEGTARSDGAELAERFERLGASVEAHADWDMAAVTMTVMTEQLEAAFALLAEVLRTPAFSEREVERLKAERGAELLQIRSEPRGLADEKFVRHVYGGSSRYGVPEGGNNASISSISRGDIVAFHAARVAPGSTTILLAGAVSLEDGRRLVEQTFADWRGPTAPRTTTIDAAARETRAIVIVPKAEAPQSELRIGHVGLPRNHPDYFPIIVMNSVLGGVFNSRINLNLREVHAYTYGAFSAFDWRRQAGPFFVSTAVRTDVTAAAIHEVLLEIERIRSERIRDEELSLVTSYLNGVFPIRFETTAAIAAALANIVVHGLPSDYYDSYRSRVMAVTSDDVLAVAQAHLHPDRLQIIAVGDLTAVQPSLEALQLGPVLVDDRDEHSAAAE